MKRLTIILFFIILVVPNISAIEFSEIESNPPGSDSGNEWIEFFSDEEVNLEGYNIRNADGDKINLSGNFMGFFVYTFEKQWLDNTNEKIYLYKDGELIDETHLFKDTANDDRSWQYCNKWEFKDSTKGEDDGCKGSIEEEPVEDSQEEIVEEQEEKNTRNEAREKTMNENAEPKPVLISNTEVSQKPKDLEVIKLNAQTIKSQNNNEDRKNSNIMYFFVAFAILLGILIILMKKKQRSEF